jgi:GNAT superfamily N-acetyltransferase
VNGPAASEAIRPAVEIRAARAEDLGPLVAAFGQEHYFRGRLERQRRGVGDVLIAWCDGRVVGDVHLIREPVAEAEIREKLPAAPQISHLEVAPEYRRQSIASALLDAVEALAFEHGHTTVCLGVGVTNPARPLYDGRGYDDWGHGTVVFRWESKGPDGRSIPGSELCHVLMKFVDPSVPGLDRWDAWVPSDLPALVGACEVPWYVAAGWAIDLHLGHQTRPHEDLEVAIARADFARWRELLRGFELYDAGGGRLRRLRPGQEPDPANHQVWVCDPAVPAWRMDTFLEAGDRDTWVCHRDARVRVAMNEAVARSDDGIPYLRPEFVLLGKAKHRRPKDEADLAAVLPRLTHGARRWLAEALELVHPGHPWIDRVAG